MLGSGTFAPFLVSMTALTAFMPGCKDPVDTESPIRTAWVHAVAQDGGVGLREVLNGTEFVRYHSGFYPLETDPETRGAWRWMGRKGIVRLLTKPGNAPHARDMELEVFGWVPFDARGLRTHHLEFAVNGHVLERYEPESANLFSRKFRIPHALLDNAAWVDLVITVSNVTRVGSDWRELGFATTGVVWQAAGEP